jgi:hypothetical protein
MQNYMAGTGWDWLLWTHLEEGGFFDTSYRKTRIEEGPLPPPKTIIDAKRRSISTAPVKQRKKELFATLSRGRRLGRKQTTISEGKEGTKVGKGTANHLPLSQRTLITLPGGLERG